MKVAALQFRAPKGCPDEARAQLVQMVDEAGSRGARLVVCPEMATTGYVWASPREIGPLSEPPRGPTFIALSAVARRHGTWVVCGFPERFEHRRKADLAQHGRVMVSLFNSALVISPEGELATCYRKVLLYEADKTWANAGWRRPVVPTAFGRMAPGICMDINDPGFVEHLHREHVDVAAFCTNWVQEGADVHAYWRARLDGWPGWLVAGNTWGEDRGVRFSGNSAILGPGGRVVAEAGKTGDAVIVAEM